MTSGNDRFGLAAALDGARALNADGRTGEADAVFEEVAQAVGPAASALRELAINALRRGDRERAIHYFRRTVALMPEDSASLTNLGVALRGLGRLAEAVEAHDAALRINPKGAVAWANRGNALGDLGRFNESLVSFDAAIANLPDNAGSHIGRARALINLVRGDEALDALDRAEALNGRTFETLYLRGHALNSLDRAAEALVASDAALALQPDHALAQAVRAQALLELHFTGDDPPSIEDVEAAFARSLELDPSSADLQYARGLLRLRRRQFEAGWTDFERRWEVSRLRTGYGQMTPELLARMSRNLKPADLDGRRVLLVSEQGVGDDMMFASMIPDVLARASQVSLICERRLHRLFGHSFPRLDIVPPLAEHTPVPPCDHIIPLGGLGAIFRTRPQDFTGAPYLRPTHAARTHWSQWLGPRAGLRVGISWRGGVKTSGRARRSMELETLRPLLSQPGCEFVNLQYGDTAQELAAMNATLERPIRAPTRAEIDDFDDLAGLIAELDMVVSVQTAVVHISGAIGSPCLALLSAKAEWRYGVEGETMPWYASVRLLRQDRRKTWGPVIDQAVAEVQRRVREFVP